MANELLWTGGTSRTTGISGATLAAGANFLGDAIDNGTNKDRFCAIEVTFTGASTPTVDTLLEIYILYAADGTNYEDGDATPTDPKKPPVGCVAARAVAGAQKQTLPAIPLSPFKFKILVKSELDVAITSALTVLCHTYNEELQ